MSMVSPFLIEHGIIGNVNWTELNWTAVRAHRSVSSPTGIHVFRTNRPISLQCLSPIRTKQVVTLTCVIN